MASPSLNSLKLFLWFVSSKLFETAAIIFARMIIYVITFKDEFV
jgi:hypothetical protein